MAIFCGDQALAAGNSYSQIEKKLRGIRLVARQAGAGRLVKSVLATQAAGMAALHRLLRPWQRGVRPTPLQPASLPVHTPEPAWLDAVPMLLAGIDAQQRYRHANLAYLRWMGHARADILGQTVAALHTPAATAALQLGLQRALAGETCSLPVPTGHHTGPGSLQLRFQPDPDADGHAGGVLLFGSAAPDTTDDGTAPTQSVEELIRYAHVVSHDLREPLRMVSSFGQLLMRRHHASLAPEAQEFLQFMVDGSERAQLLIHDLLRLARLDGQPGTRQAVALGDVLADVQRELAPALQASRAVVTQDALPTLMADALQMRQLLGNLLGNALKFCGPAALRIHVGAVREPGQWRIRITDSGIGIDPAAHRRIFGMFQRLHSRSAYEGTGIGLAICERVVHRLGGQIGVDSTPGQGASFHFTVPDATGQPETAEP